jgi:hypothetical protein
MRGKGFEPIFGFEIQPDLFSLFKQWGGTSEGTRFGHHLRPSLRPAAIQKSASADSLAT